MFPFNRFPGTNMHDLDLDWILKVVREMDIKLSNFITNWSNPITVYTYDDFADTKLIYLYMGNEVGYNHTHWYYYNTETEAWTDGGQYGAPHVDDELSSTSTNPLQNKIIAEQLTTMNETLQEMEDILQSFKLPELNPDGIIHIAHAGAEDLAPANTSQGLIWAKEVGFDYAELDVRACRDGFVICHNATTTGFAGYGDYTIREVNRSLLTKQPIIAGSYINLYPDLKMMDLDTAILICKQCKIVPQLELKDDNLNDDEVQLFYDTLKKYGILNNCTVKSFYYNCLDRLKTIDKSVRCEYIIEDDYTANIELAYNHGFDAVDIKIDGLTIERVMAAHNFGMFVDTWTIDSQGDAKTAIDCGVDAITTISNMFWTNGASMDYAIGVVQNIPIFNPAEAKNIESGNFINRNYVGSTAKENIYNTVFNSKYAITTGLIPGNGSGGDVIRFLIPSGIRAAVQGWDSDGAKIYDSGWINGDNAKHSFTSTGNCASYTISMNRTDGGELNQRVLNNVFNTINIRVV